MIYKKNYDTIDEWLCLQVRPNLCIYLPSLLHTGLDYYPDLADSIFPIPDFTLSGHIIQMG